jgi:hypothetical protein
LARRPSRVIELGWLSEMIEIAAGFVVADSLLQTRPPTPLKPKTQG